MTTKHIEFDGRKITIEMLNNMLTIYEGGNLCLSLPVQNHPIWEFIQTIIFMTESDSSFCRPVASLKGQLELFSKFDSLLVKNLQIATDMMAEIHAITKWYRVDYLTAQQTYDRLMDGGNRESM